MDDNSGLPISSGPKDHVRLGFSSLEQEKNTHHSIEVLQSSSEVEWALKLDTIRRTYGSHMAMRLATEKAILSRSHRLPGLESSHVALETLMGTAESIDYKDFLNGKSTRLFLRPCQFFSFSFSLFFCRMFSAFFFFSFLFLRRSSYDETNNPKA
jgi:hypothetical protein